MLENIPAFFPNSRHYLVDINGRKLSTDYIPHTTQCYKQYPWQPTTNKNKSKRWWKCLYVDIKDQSKCEEYAAQALFDIFNSSMFGFGIR